MKVIDQGLEAFFIHEISKVAEGVGHNKEENRSAGDDGNFDPFHAGQEGDGEKEDVSREGDKRGNQHGVLDKEREGGCIFPDGHQDNNYDDQGADPPQEFCQYFIPVYVVHVGREDKIVRT